MYPADRDPYPRPGSEQRRTPPPAALRALAHPVRLRILGDLRVDGPSTATRLAERLGLNSGATSYHLRQLAQHGFVTEVPDRGSARDRWWRAAQRSTYTSEEEVAADERDAIDAFGQAIAIVHAETMQRAAEERPLLPPEWRKVHALSDWQIRLTAEQAYELVSEVHAVFERWASAAPATADDAPEGAVPVAFQLHSFPRPGTVAVAPADDR